MGFSGGIEGDRHFIEHHTTRETLPLPDPDTLARLESIVPGFASRFLDNVIAQSSHRMQLENKEHEYDRAQLDEDLRVRAKGQNAAIGGAVFGMGAFAVLVYLGHPGWAVESVGTILGIIGGAFVYGKVKDASTKPKD